MQSAKALLICMDASSEVALEAQANGRGEGDYSSDGIRPSGAMAGNRATPSIEGQESQTPPDSPTSKSDICKPIISGVAFRWHFLILVQEVGVNKYTYLKCNVTLMWNMLIQFYSISNKPFDEIVMPKVSPSHHPCIN